MTTPGSIRQTALVLLLAPYAATLAASPWECTTGPDGLWVCAGKEAPATETIPAAATPPTAIDTAGELSPTAAPASPPESPATVPAAPSPAREAPLFPDAATMPAPAEVDEQPAEALPETEPAGETTAPQTRRDEVPAETPAQKSTLFPVVAPATETAPAATDHQPAETDQLTVPADESSNEAAAAEDAAAVQTRTDDVPAEASDSTTLPDSDLATSLAAAGSDALGDESLEYSRWALCPPVQYRSVSEPAGVAGVIELQADNARSRDKNIFILEGNAVAEMDWQRLEADRMTYNQDEGRIDAEGNLVYTSPELLVDGERGTLYPATDTGNVEAASYVLPQQRARGVATSMELDTRRYQHMQEVSYTTCPVSSTDWEIFAREVDLDQEDGTGTARHARVEIKGIPVLYSPYLKFPLDDRRKSGLLVPKFGITQATGVDISTPWYWNIAPDKDATIVPRFMTKRGVMLGGEFRYKNSNSKGQLTGEYLPSDREFNNDDRYLVGFRHKGNPLPRLETSIKASQVSDDFYFNDFGTSLVQTSRTNLERTAAAAWHGRGWNIGAQVQNFQTIDPTIKAKKRPYEQLPTVLLDIAPAGRLLGLKFDAGLEANNFRHSGGVLVEGQRFDIQPRLSLPVNRPGWYIDPAVSVRYTAYNLDKTATGVDDTPTRTTPVVSLDAGSTFERNSRWGDTDYVQTLEPRMFYLYVPDVNQDDLPVFDTSEYDFNFWTLFRENRFSGPDRMGDANQLALALTSRILNPASGVQQFSLSVGSLLYFKDRNVTLPKEAVATDSSSNIIGEMTLGLAYDWRVKAETQWNPHSSRFDRNDIHLQYRKGSRQLVNIGYRYRRDIQKQVDLSALWPLGDSWHLVGRWYYSLQSSETLEALAGLGYESCCWSTQLVGRSYIKNRDTRQTAIFLQVELKGLGRLVNTVDKALERGILGYESLNY